MAEVPDTELQQMRALNQLFDQIWNDPEQGEAVRRKAKQLNPNIQIPDENPVAKQAFAKLAATEERVTGLQTAFDEYRTKAEQKEAETKLRSTLGDVQTKFGFTDDAMAKTIEIMQQRQLADPEAAALIYRESLPKATPTSPSARFFDGKADMYGTTKVDEKWEKLHVDPDGFFNDVINEVSAEYGGL